MKKRALKNQLYEQMARVGKAVCSPRRLELLDLLAQGEKPVEMLARELGIDMRLASAHLKALREANLVIARREGKQMIYRLSSAGVADLLVTLREVAAVHLLELQLALERLFTGSEALSQLGRHELLEQARSGNIVVIDVRPESEFASGHLPYARSMPLAEIEQRLSELPRDRDIVAYCRGPFCLWSEEAMHKLLNHGFRVRRIQDGISEWRAAGFPVESSLMN